MSRKAIVIGGSVVVVALVVAWWHWGVGSSAAGQEAGKPPVAVDVAPAALGDLVQGIDVVGQLAPKFSVDIKSEFTAVVEAVYVTEWTRVRRGEPLARLDDRESKLTVDAMNAAVLQASVAETRAVRELERARKLKEVGLATQQQLDDAVSAAEAAAASTAAARAQLDAARTRLEKAVLRAPMDGAVAYRGVSAGDRVESMGGGPIFTIVDNSRLDLTIAVPSSRMAGIAIGQALEFTTEAVPGRTFAGTVSFINPTVDQASRTIKVRAEVPNADGALRSGLFVKGTIRTGERRGVLQIPRAALLTRDVERGTADVFVVDGEIAERRSLRTGQTSSDAIEVLEGLKAGEQVVVRGGFNLRSGDRVRIASPGRS